MDDPPLSRELVLELLHNMYPTLTSLFLSKIAPHKHSRASCQEAAIRYGVRYVIQMLRLVPSLAHYLYM